MLRWIGDSLRFLYWLGLLQLARLAVVLFCIAEVFCVLTLWPVGFYECRKHDSYLFLLLPIGATFLVALQVALWQFTWLRLAQRGGKWRGWRNGSRRSCAILWCARLTHGSKLGNDNRGPYKQQRSRIRMPDPASSLVSGCGELCR